MTSIWTAEHGWCYLNAIVDCCTREIPAWALDIRCRKQEALAVVEAGVAAHGIDGDQLVLGTDNGTAYTSRGFRARLQELGITHRRGGYRDPESQAFIESWFGEAQAPRGLAPRLRDPRRRPRRNRALRRALPPPTPPVPRLPDPEGGEADLGGCPGSRTSTKSSGLRCQRWRGPGQSCTPPARSRRETRSQGRSAHPVTDRP